MMLTLNDDDDDKEEDEALEIEKEGKIKKTKKLLQRGRTVKEEGCGRKQPWPISG